MKNSDAGELLGLVAVLVVAVFVYVLCAAVLTQWAWNSVIVTHLTGASRMSFWNAAVLGIVIGAVAGGSSRSSRSR